MARSSQSALTPQDRVARALEKENENNPEFRIYAKEIPRDAYGLLIFARSVGCSISRVAEEKFQFLPPAAKAKTFPIKVDTEFRRTFKLMVKAFLTSPDQRLEYLKRSEQYAEACLSSADNHARNDGFLVLEGDILAPMAKQEMDRDSKEATSGTPLISPSPKNMQNATGSSRLTKSVKPYSVKEYQTAVGGVVRDSSAILEVEYEGGEKSYRCSICGFERENRQSINGHMGKHSAEEREQSAKNPNRKIIAGYSWEPTPRQSTRITRLANEISMAMEELGLTSPTAIASAIIEARSKNPHRDDNDEPLSAEMSAEQQVEAIRRILGADIAAQEERRQQEGLITGLQNQIDVLRVEVSRKDQAKDELRKEYEDYKKEVAGALQRFVQ